MERYAISCIAEDIIRKVILLKNMVEICANCGKISKEHKEDFLCAECGAHVSVMIPIAMFKHMVESGAAKE